MIKIIPIKKEGFIEPTKQNYNDAGFDVVATSKKWTGDYIEYGLGFTSELPHNVKGVIVPRSSISKYDLIMCNSPAQIDPGYKGEWKVRFKCMYKFDQESSRVVRFIPEINSYNVGDRIAQIFFEKIQDLDVVGVKEGLSTREDGAFGSTGK